MRFASVAPSQRLALVSAFWEAPTWARCGPSLCRRRRPRHTGMDAAGRKQRARHGRRAACGDSVAEHKATPAQARPEREGPDQRLAEEPAGRPARSIESLAAPSWPITRQLITASRSASRTTGERARALPGVVAVRPLQLMKPTTSAAFRSSAPAVWQSLGLHGEGVKIAIIDTASTTPSQLRRPGHGAAYTAAHATETAAGQSRSVRPVGAAHQGRHRPRRRQL